MTITQGTTVKSKLTGKTGTVTREAGNGSIFVRQDGEEDSHISHESRWTEVFVTHAEREHLENYGNHLWKKGDHIRLTDSNGETFTATALGDKLEWGDVFFSVITDDGRVLPDLNFNAYSHTGGHEVLFRASVARGTYWE